MNLPFRFRLKKGFDSVADCEYLTVSAGLVAGVLVMGGSDMNDRRRTQRNRVYWGGEISFSEYLEPFECVVRDISVEGARICLANNTKLPEAFKLWVASRQMHVRVRQIWREGPVAGIRIEGFEPPKSAIDASKPVVPKAAIRNF